MYGDSETDDGIASARFRRISTEESGSQQHLCPPNEFSKFTVEPGSVNVLSANYESLDYDTCENHLLLDEERKKGYRYVVRKNIARWFIFLLIGMITALVACLIDISIEELSKLKYASLARYMDEYVTRGELYVPLLIWVGYNVAAVSVGAALVAYVEPVAAGSGIPQVKCYLNGVKMPHVVRIKTLLVKSVGVVCSVVGGLAGGKEGPMIHSGAVIAAGISQGKSTTFATDLNVFQYFREDREKLDFVSAGAAAGVSAAFGAPVGGVLFSLEEGTSFWNQGLTWRTFFASVVSTFTLNAALSTYHGRPGDLSYPGLLNLGQFDAQLAYRIYEVPLFAAMGALGGLIGAAWNHLNYRLAAFRQGRVSRGGRSPAARVAEACLVAAVSAVAAILFAFLLDDCRPVGGDAVVAVHPVQMYCADGERSAAAALWMQTPEATVRSLFHDPAGSHRPGSLLAFVIVYFALSAWTFGLAVSAGLFIPTLLLGAAWGRLVAECVRLWAPATLAALADTGKYALIGAAAQLGGVVRMTISLTVIIMETTGDIRFALPLIVTLIAAKWTGDFFNEGIYDLHIRLAGVPLLPWEPPPLAHNVYASVVMSHPVVTVRSVENAGRLVRLLAATTYNGFPVVDQQGGGRRIRGLILRSQLIVLLKRKLFDQTASAWVGHDLTNMFRDEYPRYPTADVVQLTDTESTYCLDLRPYMNASPYTVLHSTSLPRMFRLFRTLGLRHLPIVSDTNEVIGMVTRKDLARYRVWHQKGKIGLEELSISKEL